MSEPDEYQRLADELRDLADALDTKGATTNTRFGDWVSSGVHPDLLAERGHDATTPTDAVDVARAERLRDEWARLIRRYRADTPRLLRLIEIAHPSRPIRQRLDSPAQVANDGYCRSCWRNDNYTSEVDLPRYRDYCRWCGDWHRDEGQPPPLGALRIVHRRATLTGASRFTLTADEYETVTGRTRA